MHCFRTAHLQQEGVMRGSNLLACAVDDRMLEQMPWEVTQRVSSSVTIQRNWYQTGSVPACLAALCGCRGWW